MAPRWESLRKVYCERVDCKVKLNLGHIPGLEALARGLPALPEQLRISVLDDLPGLRSRASRAISLLTNPKSSKVLQPTNIPSPFQSTHASTLNSREKPAPNETVAIACKRSYPQSGGSANSKRGPLFAGGGTGGQSSSRKAAALVIRATRNIDSCPPTVTLLHHHVSTGKVAAPELAHSWIRALPKRASRVGLKRWGMDFGIRL